MEGKLKFLYLWRENLVEEMNRGRYKHNSPLAIELATGESSQSEYVDSYEEQVRLLKGRECGYNV